VLITLFAGVFGVPLEILVEKTGSDSQLGASNTQLRVPEFVDNVISAMKQMGKSIFPGRVTLVPALTKARPS
jgi:hypothetical protein